MRDDVLITQVLDKCKILKQCNLWPNENRIRPQRWLGNFDKDDRSTAAFLLDKFTYYNDDLTNRLFVSSYHSLGDGLSKGPAAPTVSQLVAAIDNAIFTPVRGETPRSTDSGLLFCRKSRQILHIPDDQLPDNPVEALRHAQQGFPVVFVDDFIGSGDQFIKTWERKIPELNNLSFKDVHANQHFIAIYIALVSTDYGLQNIHTKAPSVAVSVTHTLGAESMIQNMDIDPMRKQAIFSLLQKYHTRLTPEEDYIANRPDYLKFGYKNRGLLFGFEHSVPDATLPIFWSPGTNWVPLIERL